MSPDSLGNKIEDLINEATEQLSKDISKSQRNAYNTLLYKIKELDTYPDGRIKRTKANIRLIKSISSQITKGVITDSYVSRVSKYLGTFTELEAIQSQYFSLTFSDFIKKDVYSEIKELAINRSRDYLLNAGIDANFSMPVRDILEKNITSGASYTDMVEEIRNFILGDPNTDGRLLAYTKQITSDSLHTYAGVYNESVSEDLGLDWIKFTGSIKDTTRPFCQKRTGKFYHKKEVEGWADEKWSGKMKGTNESNIFYYVGGYHCRHILVYVSESIVPKKDIDRIKS